MRRKRIYRGIVWGIFFVILGMICLLLIYGKRHKFLFEENNVYLDNPDRGIYVQVFTDHIDYFEEEYASLEGKERIRVILLAYDLEGYEKNEFLPESKLEELREALQMAQAQDVSVVFRAAYDFNGRCNDPIDIRIICNHVEQISEILMEYEEELICIQAGMLGPWGEWHSSEYIDSTYTEEAHEVLTTWIENTDDVDIALRRPSYLRDAVSMGVDQSRMTIHNDALLSTDSDMGTYNDEEYSRMDELMFIGNLGTTYMGGEMNRVSEYSDSINAIEEFSKMEIFYLNRYYNEEVWKAWENEIYAGENADEYIIKHLGYRMSLARIDWDDWVHLQQFNIYINNTGFGQLDSRYQVYLLIESAEEKEIIELEKVQEERYQGNLCYYFDENKSYNLGIIISRRGAECRDSKKNIQLANDEITYYNGINYFIKEF